MNSIHTGRTAVPIFLIWALFGAITEPISAAVQYVDAGASGANNGTSWAHAYTDLQSALAAAVAGDEIWVAAGTYKPAGPGGTRTATFQINNGVSLYGGFIGIESSRSQRNSNPLTNNTVLSGDLNGDDHTNWVNYADNCYHVVRATSVGATTSIDGFLITGGNANVANNSDGGGLYLYMSDLTVSNCAVIGNRAISYGGGAFLYGNMVVTSCVFRGNYCSSIGGGSAHYGGTPSIRGCEYSGNAAMNGAGMCATSIYVTNCTLSNNVATNFGGGVYAGTNTVLTNCILWGNADSSGVTSASQCYASNAGQSLSYSCIEGGWAYSGTQNISLNPQFLDALGPDGVAGTPDDDLRLATTSPCIDAGNSNTDTNKYLTGIQLVPDQDLLGNRRYIDNSEVADTGVAKTGTSAIIDMGSYEYNGILIQTDRLVAAEGGTVSLTVSLERLPSTPTQVDVAFQSGDTDLSVQSGMMLTFTPSDFTTAQTVILAAAEDADIINGSAYFTISSPSLLTLTIQVDEIENDVQGHVYVDSLAAPGGIGNTWASPFNDLQAAIAISAASGGAIQEVWVKEGTYNPDVLDGDRTKSFQLASGIAVYGGFVGTETSRDQRDSMLHPTILSGDLNGNDGPDFTNRGDNSLHVVRATELSAPAALDGFTITGGEADLSTEATGSGGGIYASNAAGSIIRNCVIRGNRAKYYGGGLFSNAAAPLLVDCVLEDNVALHYYGGGAYVANTTATGFVNCQFFGNTAPSGGGLYLHNTVLRPMSCVFSGNTCAGTGSAIHVYRHTQGSLTLHNATVVNNHSTAGTTAVYLTNGAGLSLSNSILWGNSDKNGCVDTSQLTSTSGGMALYHSCIQSWTGNLAYANVKENIINEDPFFADADGLDGVVGTADDDLRLRDGSPCIDSGKNSSVPADSADLDWDGDTAEPTPFDIRNQTRFFEDISVPNTGAGTSPIVDMGAYETGVDAMLVVSGSPATVPEGGTATLSVSLCRDPGGPITLTVTRLSGDANILVQSGTSLTFDSSNYSTPQAITLAAAEDVDFINSKAWFQISTNSALPFVARATEADNDTSQPLLVNISSTGANNGMTWADAYTDLQSALNTALANPGQVTEIWVARGTYRPSARTEPAVPRTSTFELLNGVAIYGGFVGNEGALAQRDYRTNVTILSGDLGVVGDISDNAYHVVTSPVSLPSTGVLDGFTITGGLANRSELPNTDIDEEGAGLHEMGGSPTIRNCTFRANRAAAGAAIAGYGSATIHNCRFIDNNAYYGGAVRSGDFYLYTDCLFMGNVGGSGGAISIYGCAGCPSGTPRTRLYNCSFIANAGSNGGALYIDGHAYITATGCTFVSNTAVSGPAIYHINASGAVLSHCVFDNWDRTGATDPKQFMLNSGSASINWSLLPGWSGGTNNSPIIPLATADGHLVAGATAIDAGDPAFSVLPLSPWDRDLDARVLDGNGDSVVRVDIGSDEFIDSDGDHLPDWFEIRHPAAGNPAGDADFDGLSNLEEYLAATDPTAPPVYADAGNAPDPVQDGSAAHPYDTVQKAINATPEGGTVIVLPGIYSGAANTNLQFGGKALFLRSRDGASVTTLDAGGARRVFDSSTTGGHRLIIQGFTLANGLADQGAGVRLAQARLCLRNCVLESNQATTQAGGLFADLGALTVDGMELHNSSAPSGKPTAGCIANSRVELKGDLNVRDGRLDVLSSAISGEGHLNVSAGATLKISGGVANAPATVCTGTIQGTGLIQVDSGQQLTLADNGVINLLGSGGTRGSIQLDGRLLLKDQSRLLNSSITVKQAEITSAQPIQFNDIHMVDALGAGGELFVQDSATVSDNSIISEGDRYLDLDPNPDLPSHPTISNNQIAVLIKTDRAQAQGTMLELRAHDDECRAGGANPDCVSGAFPASVTGRFQDEPAQNWVLEKLEIQTGAKLNLTNRPGFEFQLPGTQETVYAKKLKLHPDAILNTALQTLYYEQLILVDAQGLETAWTGAPPFPPAFPNDSQIVDIPLLGFSLGVVAMDDMTVFPFNEFEIRVRTRPRDVADQQPDPPSPPLEGIVERIADGRGTGNGIMSMLTQAPDKQAASSVAAKAAFARSGEENIVVAFDYLFTNGGALGDAELIVSLSNKQEVGQSNYEVARIRPPASGLPGSIGSTAFALFHLVVPYEDWSTHLAAGFKRGTYVELELRGKGAAIRVDNWDPQVTCRYECSSFDGVPGVTEADFLILLAEYGRTLAVCDAKDCLDSRLNKDHYLDISDLLNWDAFRQSGLNSCGTGGVTLALQPEDKSSPGNVATSTSLPSNSVLVSGKSNGAGQQSDILYTIAHDGSTTASSWTPAGGTGTRANGRLVRDSAGKLYQVHGSLGLVRLEDHAVIIGPRKDIAWSGKTVTVGMVSSGSIFTGIAFADAAFDPVDPTVVYVSPVVVTATSPAPTHSYRAIARIVINPGSPGEYALSALYGTDPYTDSIVTSSTPLETSPYNIQKIREMELDRTGSKLLVTSSQGLNNNEWLLIYDTQSGAETRVRLTDLNASLISPEAMFISSRGDKLYLSSSADMSAHIYRLDLSENPPIFEGSLALPDTRQITSMSENPADGKLYAMGFQMPEIPSDLSRTDPRYAQYFSNTSSLFTSPRLAVVAPAGIWSESIVQPISLGGAGMTLPVAALYLSGSPADFNQDGHVNQADLIIFIACASGPAITYDSAALPTGCSPMPMNDGIIGADFDADRDVDATDFGSFQRMISP